MEHFSDVHYFILRLLAECGWASPALLEAAGYSYTYRTRTLKSLLEQQYIRKQGKGKEKAYALSTKGRNHLAAFNANRFSGEAMALNRQLSRRADERSKLRGDAAAFLYIAGYAVYPDDKPAFPAHTPLLPEKPAHEDWALLYQNARPVQYPGEQDRAVYTQRLTPVNCYYDAACVKELLSERGRDGASVRYSRACGVLMTPSCLLRVYHSRDVAMKFHITGEQNLKQLLLSGLPYSGFLPAQGDGALIFGTGFSALRSVMEHYMAGHKARAPVYTRSRKGGYEEMKGAVGERLTPGNLGEPAFYLPLIPESLTLLQMMSYPFWEDLLVREINRYLFGLEDQGKWCFTYEGASVYLLPTLRMGHLAIALTGIRISPEKRYRIVCLDWQAPQLCELLKPFADRDIRITAIPAGYMDALLRRIDLYWTGGGI